MTEKEIKKPDSEVEEKRIRPAVIRRRAKSTAVKAKEPLEKKESVEESAKKAKVEEEAKDTLKKAAPKKAAAKEAPAKKAAAKKAPAKKAAPRKAPAKKAAAKKAPEKKPAAKKEVTVFGKEVKPQRAFTPRQIFRKGKRYQVRQVMRKSAPVQHARALKKTEITVTKAEKRVIRFADAISVGDLSQRLGVKAGELIKKLMGMGIMATVNQFIEVEAATLVAKEYDYEVESVAVVEDELLAGPSAKGKVKGDMTHRPPVVTVMGHVDHGKTSLLDAIRRTNVATAEAGGITQHIGAYHVHLDKGDITFLDTPGHEAFTSMRARGAKATDLVVLVVAADDGVMPQTVEAINHAKAAGVPILVAVNKMDLPGADPEKIMQSLTEYGLVKEEWGGDTIFVQVSAKQGTNIKELLEMILMQAEMLELKSDVSLPASGVVIEAKLDKGRGPVSTVLVQNGTLKAGAPFVAGLYSGRVRAMLSDWGKRVKKAGPSMPVEILGLSGVPEAGDVFTVVGDEATAKQIALIRQKKNIESERMKSAKVSLTDLYDKINQGEVKELSVVLKADVHGSIEAVKETLEKLQTDAVSLKVIHGAPGGITEGDIMLAAASNAIVIGFNVRAETKAEQLAAQESVDLRFYNVIYNLVDDIKNAMEGLLEPIIREEVLGRADIREVFRVSKVGNIAGSYVTSGKITRTAKARLIRDNVVVYEGVLSSLKRFKDDAKEVQSGYECGIGIEGYNDIKVGDVIEAYELKEEAAKL